MIFILMIFFTILNKKKQAINSPQESFYSYHTFHNNKQNGTNNKFAPEIFPFV